MIIETIGDNKYSVINLVDEIPDTLNGNILVVLREGWKLHKYYMPDGSVIAINVISGHELTNRRLWSLLANTFYNPKRTLKVKKVDLGKYKIEELKKNILKWVGQDDDVLLQFIGEDDIQMLLSRVETFDDLIFVIRAINGEFETNLEFEKQLVDLGMTWLIKEE